MQAIINFLRRNPGILFNLIFSFASWLYGIFLRRDVLEYARNLNPQVENPPANYTVGIVMLLVMLCETIGIYIKSRDIRYRLMQPEGRYLQPPLERSGVMMLIFVLHIVSSLIIGGVMLSAFGIDFEKGGWMILLAIILRDLYLFYLAFLTTSEPSRECMVSGWKKFIGNACLVFWGLVAYTVCWERFAVNFTAYFQCPDLFSSIGSIIQFAFVVIGLVLLSLILFVPTRFGFIVEETTFLKDKKDRMYFALSLGLAVASSIIPYVIG